MKKKSIIISIAIAIILALFVGYGIEVFNPTPDQEDFCRNDLYEINSESKCLVAGGEWNSNKGVPRPVETTEVTVDPKITQGFCNPGKACYDGYQNAMTDNDLIVFIAAVLLGLIAVVIGVILKKDAVSMGVLSGGVILILYGTLRYWRHANDILKFIILGIALGVLIFLSYKLLDKKLR